jgi:hypothetical protein
MHIKPTPQWHELLTDIDLAAYLSIKVSTLRKWRVTGRGVPWIKVNGSLVRYRLSDIHAYLDSCFRGGQSVANAV